MTAMPQPYSPLAFANEFIGKSDGIGVVHMKLQKLVYLCYGWWLVEHEASIINEAPEVWQHGPVFASLYDVLKGHGHTPIKTKQRYFFNRVPDEVDLEDDDAHSLIDWVWQRYGNYDQFYLSDLTHQIDTPWYKTAAQHKFRVPAHTKISDAIIKEHFCGIAADRGFVGNEQ